MPGLVVIYRQHADKMEAIRLWVRYAIEAGICDGRVCGFSDKKEMAVSTEVDSVFAIPHGSPKFVRHSGIAVKVSGQKRYIVSIPGRRWTLFSHSAYLYG